MGGGGGDNGAAEAAAIQAAASREAVAEQRRQFAITQENLAPLIGQLSPAVSQESALLGLSGQEAQQAALAAFNQSPGQQFLRDQGEQALLRNTAAIGGLGGGNVRTELQRQGQGFASQALGEQLNRLASIRGGSQSAVLGQGQLGAQSASAIGAGLQNAAAAQASGILAQNRSSGFGNALSGAVAGASLGSAVPVIGTGVGAVVGGLAGLLS
jgi:hypothetical protein